MARLPQPDHQHAHPAHWSGPARHSVLAAACPFNAPLSQLIFDVLCDDSGLASRWERSFCTLAASSSHDHLSAGPSCARWRLRAPACHGLAFHSSHKPASVRPSLPARPSPGCLPKCSSAFAADGPVASLRSCVRSARQLVCHPKRSDGWPICPEIAISSPSRSLAFILLIQATSVRFFDRGVRVPDPANAFGHLRAESARVPHDPGIDGTHALQSSSRAAAAAVS